MKKPHWTDDDIDLLQKYYQTRSKEDLQKIFPNRSWKSISHRANRLKIVRASIISRLRPKRIGNLVLVVKVYVAGLLDGEGMITVSVKKNKADPQKGGSPLTPVISISNTKKELMVWLSTNVAGCTIKTDYDTEKRKDVFAFQIARLLDVQALLEQVLPFLIVKKRQAELVLEFCNVRLQDKWMEYNPRLFEITKEVRYLNRKGKMSE